MSARLVEPQIGRAVDGASAMTFLGLMVFLVVYRGDELLRASQPTWDLATWLLVMLFVGAGGRLAWVVSTGLPNLAELAVWTFVYVFIATPALVQHRDGRFPGTTPGVDAGLDAHAALLVLIALLALAMGLVIGSNGSSAASESLGRELSEGRVTFLAAASLAVASGYIALIGPTAFFTDRDTLSMARVAAVGESPIAALLTAASTVPLLVAIHAMVYVRRDQLRRGGVKKYTLMLPVSLAVLIVVVNPLTSARYVLGTVFFSLLVLFGGYASRTAGRLSGTAMIALMLIIFPSVGNAFRADDSQAKFISADVAVYQDSGDYDAFAQTNNSIRYVEVSGVTYGRQALGVVGFAVPRDLWPTKPVDTGTLLAQSRGYQFTNLSAPLWTEAYINFWWPGVIATFAGLGILLRRLGDKFLTDWAAGQGSRTVIAMSILSFYLFILLRGSLLQAIGTFVVLVFSILVLRPRFKRPWRASV